MPEAKSIKRITNPDDESQFFDVRVVDELWIRHSRGGKYQKRKIKFLNHEPNSREIEAKTITHKALDKDGNLPPEDPGDVDDPTQKVVVEEIKKFITKHGRGGKYQKNRTKLDHDPDRNGRKTHRVRLRKDDTWLDIERTDQFSLTHGRGGKFRREIIKVKWDDDAFDATEGIPLHEGPQDGFDAPWRLDPLQNIKNVRWRDYTLDGFFMTWGYDFDQDVDAVPGPSCSPPTATTPDLSKVWASGTVNYSFSLAAGSPEFVSGNSFITPSNTTVSGEPTEPPGGTINNAVGLEMAPSGDVEFLVESGDIPMKSIVLTGAPQCYFNAGITSEGILESDSFFTVPVNASGISATLLGKPHDIKSTRIFAGTGVLTVRVGFVWRIPAGFDLSSGDPLP